MHKLGATPSQLKRAPGPSAAPFGCGPGASLSDPPFSSSALEVSPDRVFAFLGASSARDGRGASFKEPRLRGDGQREPRVNVGDPAMNVSLVMGVGYDPS